jgi:hypothetical protein
MIGQDMPTNGDSATKTWRDEVAAKVRGEVGQLEERVAFYTEQLAAARAELRSAETILRAVDPEATPYRPKSQKAKPARATPRTERGRETLAKMAAQVATHTEGMFTAIDIHNELGKPWSEPHTYMLFKELRSAELIGKGPKDPSTKRQWWRVMDLEGLQQLAASVDG